MRGCGCWGFLLSIGLIWGGGQGIYEGLKNRRPQTMTFQQFEQSKPTGGWFKISQCELTVPDAMWMEKFGSMNEVFVPVRASGNTDDSKPIFLLLQVDDPKIRATVSQIKEIEEQAHGDDNKVLNWMVAHQKELLLTRDVEGMLAFGFNDLKSKDRDKIKALNAQLAPDFVVLKEGEKPHLLTSFAMLGGGLLLLLFMLLGAAGKEETGGSNDDNNTDKNSAANYSAPTSDAPNNAPPSSWNGPSAS